MIITNYNNKLACNTFLHLTTMESRRLLPPFPEMLDFVYTVRDETKTISFLARIIDRGRIAFGEVTDYLAYLSHNMSGDEWRQLMAQGKTIPPDTDFMFYLFQRTNDEGKKWAA